MRFLVPLLALACAQAAPYRGPEAASLGSRDGKSVFQAAPLPDTPSKTQGAAVASVAKDALRYLAEAQEDPAVTAGLTADLGFSTEDTRTTLERVARADPQQLSDPQWLSRCFQSFRWTPDAARFRLTRYLVYETEGRAAPEGDFQYALYGLPRDEEGLTEQQAEEKKATLLRYRYTRQQVSAGVYRPGGEAAGLAPPLVWLTQPGHEQAILQGTTAVHLPGSSEGHLYNVFRANGIPYDRSIHDTTLQRRYWYFRSVDRVRGWGKEPAPGIALEPFAAVAGDIYNLGVGRLIALRNADGLRLVVLADTGGAFQPNLHQLDLYSGFFPSYAAFSTATQKIGDQTEAWILLRTEAEGCDPP